MKNREALSALADALCSSIGSLTNPNRVSNILQSVQKVKIDPDTVAKYIGYLEEAFLFEGAKRFNIKGNKYYESIKKYYAADVGLRNAKLNFRQQELKSLLKIDDSFRKIVIVGNDIAEYTDDKGIRYIGLFQFLLQ